MKVRHGAQRWVAGSIVAAGLSVAGALNPALAHAVCGGDRPCFDRIYLDGATTLVAIWHPGSTWSDYYNFRYSSPGGPEPQAVIGGLENRIYGVQPGITYTLKVQACDSHMFSGSTCTPWDATTFTLPAPDAPAPPMFEPPQPAPARAPSAPQSGDPLPGGEPSETCGDACQPGAGPRYCSHHPTPSTDWTPRHQHYQKSVPIAGDATVRLSSTRYEKARRTGGY
jgi:hypothetical protein